MAERCYLPANRLLADLIEREGARFALSLSGVLLDQLAAEAPAALESFQALVATGGVELLGETHHHSLCGVIDEDEFAHQVKAHRDALRLRFGVRPTVFRNTELVHSDDLVAGIVDLGYRAALVEGFERDLGGRSPDRVYAAASDRRLRLLPRNYRLSDDIAFRFGDRSWSEWPLTAGTFARWVAGRGPGSVHLFLDYETFGEHQSEATGIFAFLRALPAELARHGVRMAGIGELAGREPVGELAFLRPASWADRERDLSAWLGNRLQRTAHDRLYSLREPVLATGDPLLAESWRCLTTSDHFYYMSTKRYEDGSVHGYFSPFETPYDAYIAFMNVVEDLERRLTRRARRPTVRRIRRVGTARLSPERAVAYP